jgi:hypothetical protein
MSMHQVFNLRTVAKSREGEAPAEPDALLGHHPANCRDQITCPPVYHHAMQEFFIYATITTDGKWPLYIWSP